MRLIPLVVLLSAALLVRSAPAPPEQVGPLEGGGYLLNSGWGIRPAGTQVPLDTLPMAAALSPDGRYLLVLNGGHNPPSISVLDPAAGRELSRTPVPDAWLGLVFSPKGDRVYASGGSRAAVYEFTFAAGALKLAHTWPVVPEAKRTARDFIGDVALSPDGRLLAAAELYRDSVAILNTQSGMLIDRIKTGRRPYRILFHPDGRSLFVTNWADGSLTHYEAASGNLLGTVRLGPQPMDMVWRKGANEAAPGDFAYAARIFVAVANTNNVYAVGVSGSKELQLVEVVSVAFEPRQPLGMTPSALALSPDGSRLYAACSDANGVAVVDVSGERSTTRGFIPAGWYPSAVQALPGGGLAILNGKGGGAHAAVQAGSASIVPAFGDRELDQYTRTVAGTIPREDTPRGLPRIEHVVYIVKENRTYDQVLGDLKEGNGDRSLTVFGENVTPNHHKLAREFVLLDNFYVNGDAGADGRNWAVAAIAPPYVERLWPNSYAGRRAFYDFEGQEPAAAPPAGYLWANAHLGGVSLRNYGHFVGNQPNPAPGGEQVAAVRDPVLARFTSRNYRGFDLDYTDVERATAFLAELAGYEKSGEMPRLLLVRLGNDRTSGSAAGKIAPQSAVADNDYALGLMVEGLSKSRFWGSMAIFVVESSAEEGRDHVDPHRAPAFVVSPFARRKSVDSTFYNSASALRTMELLLGLQPMTMFDAGARPMSAAFAPAASPGAYAAEKPRVRLDQRNPPASAALPRNDSASRPIM